MMEVTQVSDLDKMLGLLKEYTTLLRDTCQRELERRSRLELRRSMVIFFAASATLGSMFYLQYQSVNSVSYWDAAFIGLSITFAAMLLFSALSNRRQYSYDADQVAYTLKRLTEITSQYSEHATKRISDKFELDLRLAEAEGVLKMHEQVFISSQHYEVRKPRNDNEANTWPFRRE